MAVNTPVCNFGIRAPDFELSDTEGKLWSLESLRGPKGLLVMFLCNHCPYVKAILERLCTDVKEVQAMGIGTAAILSNDATAYPEDSFENMQRLAREKALPFPYLHDPTQVVARAFDAVCTPDFFGYNGNLELQYRGRLDASALTPPPSDRQRELVLAMRLIADTGKGPVEQMPSMGCSIKWRA